MKNRSTYRRRQAAAPAFLVLAALAVSGAAAPSALAAPSVPAGPPALTAPVGAVGADGSGGPGWRQSSFHLGSSSMTLSRTASGFSADERAWFTQETVSLSPQGIDHVLTSSHS